MRREILLLNPSLVTLKLFSACKSCILQLSDPNVSGVVLKELGQKAKLRRTEGEIEEETAPSFTSNFSLL